MSSNKVLCVPSDAAGRRVLYALVVAALAPALCGAVPPRALTYDQIYNSTGYAQLGSRLAPYALNDKNSSQVYTPLKGDEFRFKDKYEITQQGQLLVGFARDPFRQSIPAADYHKGVRAGGGERGKRGVVHLYNMLACASGCDPIAYKGYGCYCGLLGEGRPTDGIDNCCRIHDECYEQFRCALYTVYLQPYYWRCAGGEPLCARENHLARKGVNSCAGRLCECDRRFAQCVRRFACPRGKALCRSSPLRLLQNILLSFR